jgi:hypothetical protein
MVALDPVVGVPVGALPGRWQQLLQHGRVHRCLIGGDLDGRGLGRPNRLLEEPVGGPRVSTLGDQHVDDLTGSPYISVAAHQRCRMAG